MIRVKGNNQKFPWRSFLLPGVIILILAAYGLFRPSTKLSILPLYCGAEVTAPGPKDKVMFESNDHLYRNGHTQSDEKPRNGTFSAKLTPENIYGIATDIPGLNAGDDLVARVWCYKQGGYGVLTVDGGWGYFHSTSHPSRTDAQGWEQLTIRVKVPAGVKDATLRIYCWNVPEYNGTVFFDDYSVVPIHDSLEYILPASSLAPASRTDSNARAIPVAGYPVRAHFEGVKSGITRVTLFNVDERAVELVGIADPGQRIAPPRESVTLPAYNYEKPPRYFTANFSEGGSHFYYRIEGVDSVFSDVILPWTAPTLAWSPRQQLFNKVKLEDYDFLENQGDSLIFKTGKHILNQPVIIPAGYKVILQPQTELDFVDSAFFISRSAIFAHGMKEGIRIYSSDQTAKGFTILQAGELSRLSEVTFEGFGTLEYKGWNLTGAVNFYESDVSLRDFSINNNHCEDALNVIRSKVDAVNLLISGASFDGFDCDFCTGEMQVVVKGAGNDGLDFSGSDLTIKSAQIYNSGDKGISIGEESMVTIESAVIDGAVTGLASKDLSIVKAGRIELNNCKIGFAAYQKKPEYGGARIEVKNYHPVKVDNAHAIEEGSELILEGEKVKTK